MSKIDRRTQRTYPFYPNKAKKKLVKDYNRGVHTQDLANTLGTRRNNIRVYAHRWAAKFNLSITR